MKPLTVLFWHWAIRIFCLKNKVFGKLFPLIVVHLLLCLQKHIANPREQTRSHLLASAIGYFVIALCLEVWNSQARFNLTHCHSCGVRCCHFFKATGIWQGSRKWPLVDLWHSFIVLTDQFVFPLDGKKVQDCYGFLLLHPVLCIFHLIAFITELKNTAFVMYMTLYPLSSLSEQTLVLVTQA